MLRIYQHKLKKVMVIGGGRIGFHLSEQLSSAGIDVRLLEQDEKQAENEEYKEELRNAVLAKLNELSHEEENKN